MNLRRSVLVCVALAAVVAAYFFGRSHAPAMPIAIPDDIGSVASPAKNRTAPDKTAAVPARSSVPITNAAIPPADVPLKDAFADLQARAASGDAAAATRLSRDLGRCNRLHNTQWKNSGTADDLLGKKTDGMSEAQLRTYQVLLDTMAVRQQEAKKTEALCAGADQAMLDALVPSIAQAARLGDVDARACYLSRGPTLDARTLLDHPEALQDYRSAASSMIDSAIAAGDWRVVDLLKNAYEPGAQGLLAGLLGADPVQHYRYLKLYRLGAEPFRASALDKQLAVVAANLTPAQVVDADAWAQSSFQQNFKGPSTAATQQGWDPCAFAGS